MCKVFALFVSIIAVTFGLPIDDLPSEDLLSQSHVPLHQLANTLMSPHVDKSAFNLEQSLSHLSNPGPDMKLTGVKTSHMIETAKDTAFGAALLPIKVQAESGAVGGAIPALAAVKGSVIGSAIATPIVVKAVALPGVAAGKTAALFAAPIVASQLFTHDLKAFPDLLTHNVKTSFEDSAVGHQMANLFLVDDSHDGEDEGKLGFGKGMEHVEQTVDLLKTGALVLKAGAVGLASKGVSAAAKGAYVAGRVILKPIAIIAGAHLKFFGSGLVMGGKLIGGTGVGIAKTGSIVKVAGMGTIGLGASAVGWGLDKHVIDHDLHETTEKF